MAIGGRRLTKACRLLKRNRRKVEGALRKAPGRGAVCETPAARRLRAKAGRVMISCHAQDAPPDDRRGAPRAHTGAGVRREAGLPVGAVRL